jgi:uncharacterized protein (TIGR02145 family)
MDKVEKLKELSLLLDQGLINFDEFQSLKNELISTKDPSTLDKPIYPYSVLVAGNQIWTTENLNVETFRNGDRINGFNNETDWNNAGNEKIPGWRHMNNNPVNEKRMGKLYNGFAVCDLRGLAPKGWHLPSIEEWKLLLNNVGGVTMKLHIANREFDSGSKRSLNKLNQLGFFKGRNRNYFGALSSFKESHNFWSSSVYNENCNMSINISHDISTIYYNAYPNYHAAYVRLIKD